MPDQIITITLAVVVALLAVWGVTRMDAGEGVWFRGILRASDEELAARPIPELDRDRKRMRDLRARIHAQDAIRPSRITEALAAEQYDRLVKALDAAARAFHADAEPGKTSEPEQYAPAEAPAPTNP